MEIESLDFDTDYTMNRVRAEAALLSEPKEEDLPMAPICNGDGFVRLKTETISQLNIMNLQEEATFFDLEDEIDEAARNENYVYAIELVNKLIQSIHSLPTVDYPSPVSHLSFEVRIVEAQFTARKGLLLSLDNQFLAALAACQQSRLILESVLKEIPIQEEDRIREETEDQLNDLFILQGLIQLKVDEKEAVCSLRKARPEEMCDTIPFLFRALEQKLNSKIFPENLAPLEPWDRNNQSIFVRIDYLWKIGRFSEALKTMEDAFKENPESQEEDEDFQAYMANCLALVGRYDEALKIYDKLSDDEILDDPFGRGIVLFMNGDYEEAKLFAKNTSFYPLLLVIQWIENRH